MNKETTKKTKTIITVRKKKKYVVLPVEKCNSTKERELEAALFEAKRDIKEERFVKEPAEKHIKRTTQGC